MDITEADVSFFLAGVEFDSNNAAAEPVIEDVPSPAKEVDRPASPADENNASRANKNPGGDTDIESDCESPKKRGRVAVSMTPKFFKRRYGVELGRILMVPVVLTEAEYTALKAECPNSFLRREFWLSNTF